jgi:hypothetical protein
MISLALVSGCGDDTESADGEDGGAPSSGGATSAGGTSSTISSGGAGGGTGSSGGAGGVLSHIAPNGTIPGEIPAMDGDNPLATAMGEDAVVRLEVSANEHVGFFLTFDSGISGVVLELLRFDDVEPVSLAFTDGGSGLRTLAAVDATGPRTFWLRVSASEAFDGNLEVVRTPYQDAGKCADDCAVLLQLPVANDPLIDGYDWTPSTVFRYQFGRRDLVMLLRYAGTEMRKAGRAPFIPEDLSQWNGLTPGVDVGAPRHASHKNGKDVDISLYGDDKRSEWRSYCNAQTTSEGRQCLSGTAMNFDGRANAEMFGAFLQSERVTMSFLDRVLIPEVEDGAADGVAADTIPAPLLPLYSDDVHIQHWPNHDNHIHIRLSDAQYGAQIVAEAEFEAP